MIVLCGQWLFLSLSFLACFHSSNESRDEYMRMLVTLNLGGLKLHLKCWVCFHHQDVCLSNENVKYSQELMCLTFHRNENLDSEGGPSPTMFTSLVGNAVNIANRNKRP